VIRPRDPAPTEGHLGGPRAAASVHALSRGDCPTGPDRGSFGGAVDKVDVAQVDQRPGSPLAAT
jgi:hypothetical protein